MSAVKGANAKMDGAYGQFLWADARLAFLGDLS
jgi:hypothetical protein